MTAQRRVHRKPIVYRRAVVEGALTLTEKSRRAIRTGRVEKGDPLAAAELAGMMAMRRTPELIPHCHSIPLTGSRVVVRSTRTGVRVEAEAEALWRTGVEMEALVGAMVALLTVWDMVKYLEKTRGGSYPETRLGPVRVVSREKRAISGGRR
ncbi:MAG: cyclic pyranopterin monophosphate synthase MoaC [Thermoplasmata archaeon]